MPSSTWPSGRSKIALPEAGGTHEESATPNERDRSFTRFTMSVTFARSAPLSAAAPAIFSASTVAPTPRRPAVYNDSLTTRAGSLRNLRIWLVSTAIFRSLVRGGDVCRRLFVGDRFLDRLLDVARVGQVVVDERRQGGADESRNQVDRDVLRPVGGAARDRLHQLGTEGAKIGRAHV